MPILTEDIKLLKSAVMADVPEGGGAMTGIAVIDGQSNNLFPDTSAMDRAFGRVNLRKLFGVAHTSDTDTLMGAHVIVTQAPADPLVQASLMRTANWADTRTAAQDSIEKYLVKGPKITFRLWDPHFAGSLQIRLISLVGGTPPAGGDAIVLRNPNGDEEYVRILRVATATQTVAVVENGSTLLLPASVATCDIGNPLAFDFAGPPAIRVGLVEANFAQSFGTNVANGAAFYGIKPLALPGVPGDFSVTAAGGIFSAVVPAATVESPITDQAPLLGRASVIPTAYAPVALTAVSMLLGPNAIVATPTPIEPGSFSFTHGATLFADDSAGNLKEGTTIVGTVDYKSRLATMLPGAPSYGTQPLTLTYRPASLVGASSYSASLIVSTANQGLAYTNVFSPAPPPGSFTLSYMAQGRWYEMKDNLAGKLAGLDGSVGVGTLSYGTGSMAVTLGAIPDVGSPLLADWGDVSSAKAVLVSGLPARLGMQIALGSRTKADAIAVAWTRGVTNYTASTNAAGVLTGDATGTYADGVLTFEPNVFPDANVTITGDVGAADQTVFTGSGGAYTLTGTLPITKGSFRASVLVTYPLTVVPKYADSPLSLYDADGVIFIRHRKKSVAAGTINYATGAVTLNASVSMELPNRTETNVTGWQGGASVNSSPLAVTVVTLLSPITAVAYAGGAPAAGTPLPFAPGPWVMSVATNGPPLVDGAALRIGGSNYFASGNVLQRGWSVLTGAPTTANAGVVSSDGLITISSLPSDFANGVTWYNLAQDLAAKSVATGVFRTASAPLKTGVYQMQTPGNVASANDSGVITGSIWSGTVDYQRGVVRWAASAPIDPAALTYNAVFLQFLPLNKDLLGLDTVRLPLDGKVPIYRTGDLVVVHNTLTTQLPNPLVKGTVYALGRERIASVRIKDALGALVPSSLYVSDLNPGTITVPTASVITAYTQPLTVEHRIEDMMLTSQADISGLLKFTRSLTHSFPATTSFVSSALPFGDLFSRAFNYLEQITWTGVWSDALIGAAPLANFNEGQFPIVTTNRGAITERWAMIFTNTTAFNIVGESVGVIGTGSTSADAAPINPATGAAYFTLPALGWGASWAVGNVLRFNTAASGAPFWAVRTVLQGPASLDSDVFSIAFRGDVDRP